MRELLQASVDTEDTSDKTLAVVLCRSPHTIHCEFARACDLLGVNSRSAAVIVAMKRGLVAVGGEVE